MHSAGKRWTAQDRDGNSIYLTQERWEHILEGHSEMADFEEHVKTTIRRGHRRQEPLNPRKYRYIHPFNDLPGDSNHIVVIVIFGFELAENSQMIPNNFVATAFMKHIRAKGGRE